MTTGKDNRAAALSAFGEALAALVSVSLREMEDEKLRSVSASLMSGKAKITLAIDTVPELVVVAYLRLCDGSGPMDELFRVIGGSPSASAH